MYFQQFVHIFGKYFFATFKLSLMDNFCKYLLKLINTKVLFQNFPLHSVKHKENVVINVNNEVYEVDGFLHIFFTSETDLAPISKLKVLWV
jgi:hypothetical protein